MKTLCSPKPFTQIPDKWHRVWYRGLNYAMSPDRFQQFLKSIEQPFDCRKELTRQIEEYINSTIK